MPVYLIAGLEALFYLCAIPVCAAFRLNTESAEPFGAGVALFGVRPALRNAKSKKGGARSALRVLLRLRGVSVTLRGSLDLGDAAATALACGALRAWFPALCVRADRVAVDVSPRFGGDGFSVELKGMIKARSGQIILAAARSGMDSINGRIAQWISTRSKAS